MTYQDNLKAAHEECKAYNRMGGLDDAVIEDIAHDHGVKADDLKALCEEGL